MTRQTSTDSGTPGARRARILIGDDDQDIRALLRELIEESGRYTVVESGTGAEALAQLTAADEDARPDIALLDIRLPDLDGLEVLQQIHDQGIGTPVIFMTGYSSASLAIRAIQLKAADYLAKPFVDLDKVLAAVDRQWANLCAAQRSQSWTQTTAPDPTERIVGSDEQMIQVFKTIGQVARTRATVLLTGETGTGKERVAEALHLASDRRKGPLIKVMCHGAWSPSAICFEVRNPAFMLHAATRGHNGTDAPPLPDVKDHPALSRSLHRLEYEHAASSIAREPLRSRRPCAHPWISRLPL